jgi:hypothetical protein
MTSAAFFPVGYTSTVFQLRSARLALVEPPEVNWPAETAR